MMWSQLSKAFLIAVVFSSSAIVLIPRHILKSAQRERDRYNKHSRSLFLQLIQIRSLSFIGACIQATATALLGLAELAFVLASIFPSSSVATYVLSFLKAPPASASLSPLFLLGVVTALTGTTIRLMCFRELGPLFTFVLTIRDGHKLITSGPYALVRHPSYTGLALAFIGMTLCEVAPSSWLAEADVIHSGLGRVIVVFWAAYFAMVVVVGARAPMEDKMLQREFGREWEEYARRVRYRFVPGIL